MGLNFEVGGKIEVIFIHILAIPFQRVEIRQNVSIAEPLTEEEIEEMTQKAFEYLEKSGEKLKSRGVNVTSKVVVVDDNTSSAEEIIKAEADLDVDLIAMSTHGRRGISRWAFGSVTEKVLRGGSVPVLVVRAKK